MTTAMRNPRIIADRTWRHFCGMCWRRLEERQELARQIPADEIDPDDVPI